MNKKLFFHFRIDIAAGLMIVLSAILAMFPAVRNEYVNWDDRAFVASEFKANIFSVRNFKEIFAETVQCEYIPLVKLSFAAENLVAKRNPAVSHAINIVFHSAVSLLVFIFFYLFPAIWQRHLFRHCFLLSTLFTRNLWHGCPAGRIFFSLYFIYPRLFFI